MNNNLLVIIPCAGIGNRFSSQIEKQHASLGDLSVIETTLDTFMMFKPASKIVVVVKDPESFQKKISIKLDERFSIVSGGNSRSESVLNGIRSENIEKYDYVMDENKKLSESIKQAQENPNMHIENIAREKFNLTMPDEEFIVFEEEDENE